jgi:hypothetical protein
LVVAGLVLISGVAACDRGGSTHADSRPVEPDTASAPAAPAADIPLGESTRSASLPDSSSDVSAQGGNSTLQADAAPSSVVKAAAPVTGSDADPDAEKAPTLSAEQQELAAEVGDTRHAGAQMSADRTSADKASPDKSPG